MTPSTTELELNLRLPNQYVIAHAVQNDRLSRKIKAGLYDGGVAWTPAAGTDAVVRFVKPDGTMGFYDTDEAGNTAVTWIGNVATIMLAEQVLTVPGDVYCQINFYTASEEKLSTFAFKIVVEKSVITDSTIESTDYFNILSQQIAAILATIADMPEPYTSNPEMDGTAAPGSSSKFAPGDHVHPSDTSRVPTTRKINNKALSADITLTASDVSAVPTTRKVNNKELSSDVTLDASDVGAVPTSRTVNGKALSSNVTVNASEIPNDSEVAGTNVDDALETLEGKIGKYEILLNSTYTTYSQNYNNTWEQGGLDTNGTLITSTTRIRTTFIDIPYDSRIHIKAASGYKISVRIYKGTAIADGINATDMSWKTENDYNVPTNCAVRIAYARSDDSTIAPSDITAANAPTITVYPLNMPAKKINHNKILFIGNSKAWNTSEYVAKVLGDLGYQNTEVICPYKGGISLQNHYDNRSSTYYETYMCYTKNTYGWLEKTVVPLTDIISENKDITHVVFQQNTGNASDSTTYSVLSDLIGLFSGCNAKPKFYLMATWANEDSAFSTDDILSACKTVAQATAQIQDIIPVGHVIEKLKTNSLFTGVGDPLLSDGTHLSNGYAKTASALSIIETLFGLDDKLYLSDANNATYLINNLCFNIAKETKAYNIVDETWHLFELTSDFKNYNNVSGNAPKYKKVGNVVTIIGIVQPTALLAHQTNGYRVGEAMPVEYRPPTTFRAVCQASGMNRFLFNVNDTGTIGIARYGTTEDSDIPANAWLPFSVTYLV